MAERNDNKEINKIVSVIIPTYNRVKTIKRAIDSILKQTYQSFEIIIVDDCSTDNTEEIIKQYDDDRIIYTKNEINLGSSASRNVGLKKSSGGMLTFLDSDNEWDPKFLENRVRYIDQGYDFVFGKIEIIEKNGDRNIIPSENDIILNDRIKLMETILDHNVIDTNAIVMRRKCYKLCGEFSENCKKYEDWDYYMRIVANDELKYHFCDNVLVENYRQNDSLTYNKDIEYESLLTILINHQNNYRKYNRVFNILEKMFAYDYKGVSISEKIKQVSHIISDKDKEQLLQYIAIIISREGKDYESVYYDRRIITSACYLDYGNGYSEKDKVYGQICLNEKGDFEVGFEIPSDVRTFRWDVAENVLLRCCLYEVLWEKENDKPYSIIDEIKEDNAVGKENDYDVFFTKDPHYSCYGYSGGTIHFRGNIQYITKNEISDRIEKSSNQEKQIRCIQEQTQNQSQRIIEYDNLIRTKDSQIKEQEELIRTRDSQIKEQVELIRSRDSQIEEQEELIRTRDSQIKKQEVQIQNQSKRITEAVDKSNRIENKLSEYITLSNSKDNLLINVNRKIGIYERFTLLGNMVRIRRLFIIIRRHIRNRSGRQ